MDWVGVVVVVVWKGVIALLPLSLFVPPLLLSLPLVPCELLLLMAGYSLEPFSGVTAPVIVVVVDVGGGGGLVRMGRRWLIGVVVVDCSENGI